MGRRRSGGACIGSTLAGTCQLTVLSSTVHIPIVRGLSTSYACNCYNFFALFLVGAVSFVYYHSLLLLLASSSPPLCV